MKTGCTSDVHVLHIRKCYNISIDFGPKCFGLKGCIFGGRAGIILSVKFSLPFVVIIST